jgi:DNA replication protein DnaC
VLPAAALAPGLPAPGRGGRAAPAALAAAARAKLSHTRFLERLLAAEVEATERRRLEERVRFASFPTQITLADVDYDAQPRPRPTLV